MYIEPIKLSPKRNGKGYTSSYSVNISAKEAQSCGLINSHIIKIVDENSGQIIIKAKDFCVTQDILNTIYTMDQAQKLEQESINKNYYADSRFPTKEEQHAAFLDRLSGKAVNQAKENLIDFLLSLPCEVVCDLRLLMDLGRDETCKMSVSPGLPRFLDFYNYYGYIVNGRSKQENIAMLLTQKQLSRYLKRGMYLLDLPTGTDPDDIIPLHKF